MDAMAPRVQGPTLEDGLEEKRKALTERTPVTFERLQEWLARKKAAIAAKEEAALESARKQYAKGKSSGVSGRMLFSIDASLFVDDGVHDRLRHPCTDILTPLRTDTRSQKQATTAIAQHQDAACIAMHFTQTHAFRTDTAYRYLQPLLPLHQKEISQQTPRQENHKTDVTIHTTPTL